MPMTDDQRKALLFEGPDNIPVSIGLLPATWMKYRDELDALTARHPVVFGEHGAVPRDYEAMPTTYTEGEHVDAWGCVWSNVAQGCESIVTRHPIPTREAVHTYQPPAPGAGIPHGFMWLRLADLRGFEEIMTDFAEEPPELQQLIDMVRDYTVNESRRIVENPSDLVYYGDDLGMQTSLAISAAKWRKYLKPCYAAIFGPVRRSGTNIYYHTDGHILPIIGDLIECGVSILNPQIRANTLAGLVRECKGKVAVSLDLDRQLFPFVGPREIDDHIRESVEALGAPEGGLWLLAECGPDVPLENIEAICQAFEKYRTLHRSLKPGGRPAPWAPGGNA